MENTLYFGDNLKILREYIPDNSIDLIYLTPTFFQLNTVCCENILYKNMLGDILLERCLNNKKALNVRRLKL